MKKIICLLSVIAIGVTIANAQYVDDMYSTSADRAKQREQEKAQRDARNQRAAEQRQYEYEQSKQRSYQNDQSNQNYGSDSFNYSNNDYEEYVDDVKSAYQRRMDAVKSSSTNSSAYWDTMDKYYEYLERKYDNNLYNIIVMNDKIWVEPKYISSIFDGSDPTDGLVAYKNRMAKTYINNQKASTNYGYAKGFSSGYSSGYNNGSSITININPWSWGLGWGYPYSSSYWGCNSWYNPYYAGWGYPYYRPYYRPWGGWYDPWYNPWYRPYHRPIYYDPHPRYYGNSRHNNTYYGRPSSGGSNYRPSYNRPSDIRPSNNRPGGGGNGGNSGYIPGMGLGTGGRGDGGSTVNNRPSITRPSSPSQTDTRFDYRNNSRNERPAEKPMERPTYERNNQRPAERPTYERPSGGSYNPPVTTNSGGGRRR